MRAHRLKRLQLLTQGVALLGLGGVEAACHNEPPDTVHINAPYTPPDAGAQAEPTVEPPHVNAPYIAPDASAATAPTASAQLATSATASAAPSGAPPFIVPHMNATATPPPKTVNAPPKP